MEVRHPFKNVEGSRPGWSGTRKWTGQGRIRVMAQHRGPRRPSRIGEGTVVQCCQRLAGTAAVATVDNEVVTALLWTTRWSQLSGKHPAGTSTAARQAMLCASRLTPLRKPDGGLPPIAVGDMIYRLVTKAIIRHSNRRDFLLPHQLVSAAGVGMSRWSEQSNELWTAPWTGHTPT
jgi:hypothetical protein